MILLAQLLYASILLIVIFILFSGKSQYKKMALKIVQNIDVAIKSYVIPILTGITFDGFIDLDSLIVQISVHEWNFCIVAKLEDGRHCQHPIPLSFCKCCEQTIKS